MSLDLIARIGGFEKGMDAAARKADRTAAQIARDQKKRADEMQKAWASAGTAIGVGFTAATAALSYWVRGSIEAIDGFNDLKDASGASIENISALDRVARETGANFDQVSSTLIKFNQVLNDADPKKGAGAVLKALNLDIAELKKLDPAEALRRTAVALQGFADDGSKARAVQELFGKSVKDVAPFLKDLAEQQSLVGTVSTETAEEIDKFNKGLAKFKANVEEASRSIASYLIPAFNQVFDDVTSFRDKAALAGLASDVIKFKKELDGLQSRKGGLFNFAGDLDAQIAEASRKLEAAKAKFNAADVNRPKPAGGGRGFINPPNASTLPSLEIPERPEDPKTDREGERLAKAAQDYLDALKKQLIATEDLSVAETVLRDIKDGRLKLAGGVSEAELIGVAKQIDAARAFTKTLDDQKKAMEAIEQMQAAMDSQALAEVDSLIQGNQALRDEIELLGLEGTERAKVEQARLASTIALKDEELQMAKNNGASATQISALEREINLLTQRSKLLAQKGARLDDVKAFEEMLKRQEQAYKNIQDALGQGLYDVATGNFDNIGKAFVNMLNRMAAEAAAADLMNALFGKAGSNGQRGGGVLSTLFEGFWNFIAPARANGGGVMAGGMYQINENGPEMLAMGGKQYLMMGNQGGQVIPNAVGNTNVNNFNFSIQGPVDRRTEAQIAKAAARGLQSAQRNM